MHKNRLEAFSDGVFAIIITIMVLELKIPHGYFLTDLKPILPIFLSYILSFTFLCIYWVNHHHLLQASECVSGKVLWANIHLLFWLSLIPFATDWMGAGWQHPWPVAIYGTTLFLASIAYYILTCSLTKYHDKKSLLNSAIGKDIKGKISVVIYVIAIPLAFVHIAISYLLYVIVAVMWLIPDKRIEEKFLD